MSYMALYRKWRPDEFQEVKGQEHIVTTLRNQIKHDRIGHAYLFCGTRGTGKTTIAKLMAKAVNCENPIDGSPCNECASCKAIAAGNSMNVIEIDAASNNGVDNIRQINGAVQYSPTQGKYLVYIIDEVHMLSKGAFNALLKTLEEPPEYVIFILATTESHMIPATILSRCQRYDFRRISIETITDRLAELLERENVKATREALAYVAKAADGSMRDALSILDQCIAFHLGEELTYDSVLETIGAVDIEIYMKLMSAIVSGDVLTAVAIIDDAVWQGKDLTQIVNEFTSFVRNVLVLKLNPAMTVDVTSENVPRLLELGADLSQEYLMNYINILQEAASKISRATTKRIVLEVAVIKMCKPQMQQGYAAMEKRIEELEQRLADIGTEKIVYVNTEPVASQMSTANVSVPQMNPANSSVSQTNITNAAMNTTNVSVTQAAVNVENQTDESALEQKIADNFKRKYKEADLEEIKKIVSAWQHLKQTVMRMERSYLDKAKVVPGESPSTLELTFVENDENFMAIKYFSEPRNIKQLEEMIAEFTEREVHVSLRKVRPKEYQNSNVAEWDLSKINFDIDFKS
ncbi:MAG: DNA polymerase III subunit gamma/tau [Clostridium sp.]|nr:DNA polymerase III subunit gamma/tau [Clostridium sp.]MCM1208688.1 DNA polymerase III subunit gamma/tau [Ruminococcus sp.]